MSTEQFRAIIKIAEGAWAGSYVYSNNPSRLFFISGRNAAFQFTSPKEAQGMRERIRRECPDVKHAEIITL